MKVHPVNVAPGDTMLIPGDLHFDRHDPEALRLMLQVATTFGVNTVCLTGDTYESAGISRHPRLRASLRGRFRAGTIQAEREASAPWLAELRTQVLSSRPAGRPGGLYVITGNHEAWWGLVQDEFPGLDGVYWHELYGDIFDHWHVYGVGAGLRFGPLLVCHGDGLRGSLAKYSAGAVLANYPGQNTVYGHTHRVESCITPSYKYGMPIDHGAWTVGHMKDPKAEAEDPVMGPYSERHKQGFALIDFIWVGGRKTGELRFKLDQFTVDRAGGRPYVMGRGVLFS